MAVDISVLERRSQDAQKERTSYIVPNRAEYEAEDEHNARIRENYARLINPNYNKVDDVFVKSVKPEQNAQVATPVKQSPYLVKNARVDSDIFRADSPINKKIADAKQISIADLGEEDNEDLRPTATTIQYRTIDVASKKAEKSEEKSGRFSLTRNQKIAAIAAVAVIISLIVLIVVNSTVIANLNADIANLNTEIASMTEKIINVKKDMYNLAGPYSGADVVDALSSVAQIVH